MPTAYCLLHTVFPHFPILVPCEGLVFVFPYIWVASVFGIHTDSTTVSISMACWALQVQKHQRSHKREATKSAPYKRTTPEDHQAMEGAGVEGYRPEDWGPEETRQLDELVNQLGENDLLDHDDCRAVEATPARTAFSCVWRSLPLVSTRCGSVFRGMNTEA